MDAVMVYGWRRQMCGGYVFPISIDIAMQLPSYAFEKKKKH
jgi:hypothetical protein